MEGEHKLIQIEDYRLNNGILRLRQGSAKFFPAQASGKEARRNVRGHAKAEGLICSHMWHFSWQNAEFTPKASNLRDRGFMKE
ncbi:hypothetical protein PPTG_13750 [Phytophthora nicotianae INRA-310]|uniref:Uncharacterized protein n=1 Tax=Phytophthora nicotianae (strain INRA-310) TaxID=761204 RepID=W2Q2B8_PHYN3|nr:hypothetical protein PPTG_13750 [Phytophthora nicotianae INRA-310]ETN06415.1 hypothetical protein PPTG_13750 [Phytophthora nicotianae INRA-310]